MKRITKYIIALLIILMAGNLLPIQVSHAASAGINITSDATEVTVGEKLYVYITIDSDTAFGDFEANLTYDDEILEYQGKHTIIAGSNGFLRIKDINVSEADNTRKYALEFKALKVGSSDIAFNNPIMVYDFETGIEMAVSVKELTIQVKAAQTASNNAYLSSLTISPSKLDPAFDRNTFHYKTSVDYKTNKLIVDAIREDENAIVRISGNDSLKEGENKIVVTVIAESGDVIEYTIDAFHEYAPEEENGQGGNGDSPVTRHGNFDIIEIDGDVFAIYNGRYKLVEPGSGVQIPSGYIKKGIIVSNRSIDAYLPENNMEYDFILIYAENELGETGFYQYDKKEKTLQRYNQEKPFGSDGTAATELLAVKAKEYRNNMMKAAVVISVLSVIIAILLAMVIRLYKKSKGTRRRSRRK